MKDRLWIAVLVVSFCGACTWVDGECWLRSEDGAGSGQGGGSIIPGGGGFGDEPSPTPQDANGPPPPPECLHVPDGACFQNCLKVYADNSAECDKVESESQRNVCLAAAYTAYRTCWGGCQQKKNDCLDHCKDLCVEIWEGCDEKCAGKRVCKEQCIRELIACNEKCEEKCK